MIEFPKLTGREFRTWDWYGWFMAFVGIALMYYWSTDNTISWTKKILLVGTSGYYFIDYVWRVSYGRVYKLVYYDTILHNMYEVNVGGDSYFICAEDEHELKLYINTHYPLIDYYIIAEHPLESYIKKEHFR